MKSSSKNFHIILYKKLIKYLSGLFYLDCPYRRYIWKRSAQTIRIYVEDDNRQIATILFRHLEKLFVRPILTFCYVDQAKVQKAKQIFQIRDFWQKFERSAKARIFKRLLSAGIDSKESIPPALCSLAGRYDNHIPHRFLASIDCLKIPAQLYNKDTKIKRNQQTFKINCFVLNIQLHFRQALC